jgi:hypothetical protein
MIRRFIFYYGQPQQWTTRAPVIEARSKLKN